MVEATRSTDRHRIRTLLLVTLATAVMVLATAVPARAAGDPTAADGEYGAMLGQQAGPGQAQGAGTLPFTSTSSW
jgi:hypothetical protein